MNIWLVSREYAGIAEAGGVKNVAASLSKSLARLGNRVTLFIPLYGCTDLSEVNEFCCFHGKPVSFSAGGRDCMVSFASGVSCGVEIVFVCHRIFAEKQAVYTYTKDEEKQNPMHRQGHGHEEANLMDVIFQKAVVFFASGCDVNNGKPDIVHCQDAATALIPTFARYYSSENPCLKKIFRDTKFFVTIHNAGPGYHHEFPDLCTFSNLCGIPEDRISFGTVHGKPEPYAYASKDAVLTTVSPEYASEILENRTDTGGLYDFFAENNVGIIGITNGIDFDSYDPIDSKKSLLPYIFNPQAKDFYGKYESRRFFIENYASKGCHEKNAAEGICQFGFLDETCGGEDDSSVYVCYHGRVVHQKGIEVMAAAAESVLEKNSDARFIFIGQGMKDLERKMAEIAERFSGRCVYLQGYSRKLSRLGIASADFSLHPSYFEPCGLEDFIAQTFGTIPVAHATGGLCKIVDEETGFLYRPNTSEVLEKTLISLVTIMSRAGRHIFFNMMSYASEYIHENYSWNKIAFDYEKLFKEE